MFSVDGRNSGDFGKNGARCTPRTLGGKSDDNEILYGKNFEKHGSGAYTEPWYIIYVVKLRIDVCFY